MNPIFGNDVYRNRYYGGATYGGTPPANDRRNGASGPSVEMGDSTGQSGIFGGGRQPGSSVAPPPPTPSGSGRASNLTGGDAGGGNLTPPAPPAPTFGANINPSSPIFNTPAAPGTPLANQLTQVPTPNPGPPGPQFRDPGNGGGSNTPMSDYTNSAGELIRGYQQPRPGASATGNEWQNWRDPQGRSADQRIAEQNQLYAQYGGDLSTFGWGSANTNRGGGPQSGTFRDQRFNNPLFQTGIYDMTPERYGQIVSALNAIDPRIAQFYGPNRPS